MHNRALFCGQHADPFPVVFGQLFLILDSLIQRRQGLLTRGALLGRFQQGGGIFSAEFRGRSPAGSGFGGARNFSRRRRTFSFCLHLRVQRIVLRRKGRGRGLRLLFRLPQESLLLMQSHPLGVAMKQAPFFDGRADSNFQVVDCLRRSFMFLDHGFDAGLWIAARTGQILFRVIDFVLVLLLVSRSHDKLIVQRVLFCAGSFGFLGGQPRDQCVVRVQCILCLFQPYLDPFRVGAQWSGMLLECALRSRVCQIHLMVGNPQTLLREWQLLGGGGRLR